jgi:hypothetical protein
MAPDADYEFVLKMPQTTELARFAWVMILLQDSGPCVEYTDVTTAIRAAHFRTEG